MMLLPRKSDLMPQKGFDVQPASDDCLFNLTAISVNFTISIIKLGIEAVNIRYEQQIQSFQKGERSNRKGKVFLRLSFCDPREVPPS